jgi:hypothetical protein
MRRESHCCASRLFLPGARDAGAGPVCSVAFTVYNLELCTLPRVDHA